MWYQASKVFLVISMGIVQLFLIAMAVLLYWDWFVVGYFNLPRLHGSTALGLALLVSLMTAERPHPKYVKNMIEHATYCVTRPLVYIVLGWIIHSIFGG